MKTFKKLLPIIFTLAFISVMLVITSTSVSAETYSGECGDNLIWNLDTDTGVLIIDGTGDMYDYGMSPPWDWYDDYIKSVVINNSVTSISSYTFNSYTSLTSVIIGDSVKSIGDHAFSSCSSLASVIIGDSVISIGDYSFFGCHSLTSVIIPDSVKSIGNSAFSSCDSLTSTTIGDSVISIGDSAFFGCHSLTSVIISDSVTSIGDSSFSFCDSLTSVIIPDSVTSIGDSAFNSCWSLENISIGNSVTSVGKLAFMMCESLTNVYITDIAAWCGIDFYDYDANPLTYTSNLYLNGELITELVIPDSVSSIGDHAFANCFFLTGVRISKSVTNIGVNAFHYNNYKDDNGVALDIIITCYENSYAHTYALNNNFEFELLCEHIFRTYNSDNNATCTKDGTKTAKCDKCHVTDTVIDKDSALGHSFIGYVSDNNATCTKDGTKTAKCNRCDVTDTVTEPALGHSFTNYVDDNNATCLESGTKTAKCDRCDAVDTVIVSGLGHSFTNYVSNNNATCTVDGTKTATCDRCGFAETIVDEGSALGHMWSKWYTIFEPDPVNNLTGVEGRSCERYGCYEVEYIYTPVIDKYDNPFTDVKESAWFYSAVVFVVKKGYMKGMSDTRFSPNSNITREQFVLILANIAGVDTDEYKNESSGFTDVKTGQWYSGAVTWAVREGYVSGMSATKFGRGQSIQRAALARMLYNYASKNGIDVSGRADLSLFGDAAEFDKAGNAWMVEPVQWAVDAGIISGMTVNGKNCVNPKGTATRAQAARMLMQFDELIK